MIKLPNISDLPISKSQLIGLITLLLLLIAIPLGMYLIKNPQIFKPRATNNAGNWINGIELRDAEGYLITCDTSQNPPQCISPTTEIHIKIKDENLLLQ